MTSANKPCLNPNLCGVQSHRPGTIAKCTISIMSGHRDFDGGGAPITATAGHSLTKGQKMFLHEWVPAMMLDPEIERCVEGIVNGYESEDEREGFEDALMNRIGALGANVDEEHWVAFNAIIANKEMPPRTPVQVNEDGSVDFGNEKSKFAKIGDFDGIRIEAGSRGGAVYLGTPDSGKDEPTLHILAESKLPQSGDDPEYYNSMKIYQTEHGELWIESGAFGGHEFHTPVLASQLQKGQRHWEQDESDEPQKGEYPEYELVRRLISNPVTLRYLQQNAPVYYPGVDERYTIDGSPFTYPTGTY